MYIGKEVDSLSLSTYVTYSRKYVTRSRKRGPFPQKSDCELDLSADSTKSVVHARETV